MAKFDKRRAGVSVEAVGRPYSAPERGDQTPATPDPAHTVKLGPIGARRVSTNLSFVQQKAKNAFIFRPFRRLQQAEKTARHQAGWSWLQANFLNYFKGKFHSNLPGPIRPKFEAVRRNLSRLLAPESILPSDRTGRTKLQSKLELEHP